jgi:hypothetical protein
MDAFAALRTGFGSDPAFGGYLVLNPRVRRRPLRAASILISAARQAGKMAGVAVLCGLGVTALAAVGNCTSCDFSGSSTPTLARFSYANETPVAARDITPDGIFAAMVIEPSDARVSASDVSPISTGAIPTASITTAAITPMQATPRPTARRSNYDWLASATILPSRLEPMRDAGPPPLMLASAAPANDGAPAQLDEIAFASPATELRAVAVERGEDAGDNDADAARAQHKHHSWKRYSRRAKARATYHRPASQMSALAKKHRMPRWAQQMYDNPWQNTAFSYVR